ncbi:MAG: gliding motility lipoprotein GldB [Sediminicola sp.]|tara:strand:- start:59708 stop:60670 length:963 start_codon:yes stop_codon:yes gene_type:complete
MKKTILLFFVPCLLFFGCKEEDKVADEVEKVRVDLKVLRFDREFAQAGPQDIPRLQKKYPYLFPQQYADSVWIAKSRDTLQIALLEEVDRAFGNFKEESDALELFFKYVKYYFPQYRVPTVVTVTSDVDYNNRVILADSLLLIGLDNYLGSDHRFYVGIQKYIAAALDKEFMVGDVAGTFAKQLNPFPADRSFLAQMVYYGKELYLKDKLAPFLDDARKIGYSREQLQWAQDNEEEVWRYFIERELLYATDLSLGPRFLDPAPFSKFQLELDNESPGRIGRYMGWQIVRSFMGSNEVSLSELMKLPAEELFKRSGYKPKK